MRLRGTVGWLAAGHLLVVGWLTLRPTRDLLSAEGERVVSRTGDWELFLLVRGASWDGNGRLHLQTTVALPERGGGIGLVAAFWGDQGDDRAVLIRHKPQAGLRAQIGGYRLSVETSAAACTPAAATAEPFQLRVVVERRGPRIWLRSELDGGVVAESELAATALRLPCRFGLWSSRGGRREILEFTATQVSGDGTRRVLRTVRGGDPDAVAAWEPRIGHAPRPFSLGAVPMLRTPGPGEHEILGADLFDLAANLLLLAPLGALVAAGAHRRRHPVLAAVLGCAACSLAVEVTQLWVPTRVPSLYDLSCNTLGGWLAALATARWLRRRVPSTAAG